MRYDDAKALAALKNAPGASDRSPSRPLVIGQLGQSLDGRIATPTGKSKYISGKAALAHLHRLRAAVDAVIVGVNTVIADDPQLTVRLVEGLSPIRVIIDPTGRIPLDARCLAPDTPGNVIVIRAADAAAADPKGASVIRLPRDEDGRIAPDAILAALAEHGVRSVLIEGGSDTLSGALDAGVVDLLHVTVSPIILGSGKPGLALPPIDELEEGIHPAAEVFAFDDGDALFCCDLRRRRHVSPETLDIHLQAAE